MVRQAQADMNTFRADNQLGPAQQPAQPPGFVWFKLYLPAGTQNGLSNIFSCLTDQVGFSEIDKVGSGRQYKYLRQLDTIHNSDGD